MILNKRTRTIPHLICERVAKLTPEMFYCDAHDSNKMRLSILAVDMQVFYHHDPALRWSLRKLWSNYRWSDYGTLDDMCKALQKAL